MNRIPYPTRSTTRSLSNPDSSTTRSLYPMRYNRIPVLVAATAAASFALVGLGASPAAATCPEGGVDWPTCTTTTTLPASTTTEPTEGSEPSDTTSTVPASTAVAATTTVASSGSMPPAPTTVAPTGSGPTSTSSPTTSSPSTTPPCSGICGPATVATTTTTSLLPPVTGTPHTAPTTVPAPNDCLIDGLAIPYGEYEILTDHREATGTTKWGIEPCGPIATPTTPNQPPATTGTPTASTPGSTTPDKPELPATGTTTNVLIAVAVVFLLAGIALRSWADDDEWSEL